MKDLVHSHGNENKLSLIQKALGGRLALVCISKEALALFLLVNEGGMYHHELRLEKHWTLFPCSQSFPARCDQWHKVYYRK